MPKTWQDLVIDGEPDYGKDEEHEWPRAWYGVKGYFRWLESKAYKMHVRVLLSRYRAYTPCPDCHGQRFQPEALLYRLRDWRRHELHESKPRNSSGRLANRTIVNRNIADARRFLPAARSATRLRSSSSRSRNHASRIDASRNDPLGLVL